MNLFDLNKEEIYQNTVRVLVYPNITFQKDLEKDSYIQVIKKQIKLLNEIRDDLWFYLILPCPVPSLEFDNVTQWFIDFETYPPTMRSQFRVDVIRKMLNNSLDFDLIMSHLPEHTHQLVNTMYNVTHHTPPVFGYTHWTDVKQVVAWPKDSFLQNITGLLEYDRCYLNTQYQKELILNQSKETFNDKTIERLDDILTVQHLGVDVDDIIDNINESPEKIIVFNHRPDTYKHFKQFIALTDKLWETRKDFKVWVPLLDKPNREYVITDKGDKNFYYNKLKTCCVGFSPKQSYGGNIQAQKSVDYLRKNLIYIDKMMEMSTYMDSLLSKQKKMSDSTRFQDILEFIQKNKSVTKKELIEFVGWGRGIKWTPYRRALMNHPNVFDVVDSEPKYVWKDS